MNSVDSPLRHEKSDQQTTKNSL